ncbi:hypothetical protein SAMN05443247_06327 [Bradyrhizobium erythrophlei]|jgi:hypothetical protein|nr:hypothetical protein SAMN05443247_06327 [Bradyrhizobium erythrophlei]
MAKQILSIVISVGQQRARRDDWNFVRETAWFTLHDGQNVDCESLALPYDGPAVQYARSNSRSVSQ